MRQAVKLTAFGLSVTCLALAGDAAMGLGAAQWLADLCLTEMSDSAMADMGADPVTPMPFIALSVLFAALGLAIFMVEERDIALGRIPPDAGEHAAILSAISMTALTTGKTTESDIANIFQIVTGSPLQPELADLAFRRYSTMTPEAVDPFAYDPFDSALARRRVMAAALMVGCVAHEPNADTSAFIENLAFSIGATSEDVAAARAALNAWCDTDAKLSGSPLITLLRGKPLGLRPA